MYVTLSLNISFLNIEQLFFDRTLSPTVCNAGTGEEKSEDMRQCLEEMVRLLVETDDWKQFKRDLESRLSKSFDEQSGLTDLDVSRVGISLVSTDKWQSFVSQLEKSVLYRVGRTAEQTPKKHSRHQ